jgi:hypothetical protein
MEPEKFTITVNYKGSLTEFDAELRPWGYSWKIIVFVNEQEIIFEPDEERNFRAILANESARDKTDVELVRNIGEMLEQLFKK